MPRPDALTDPTEFLSPPPLGHILPLQGLTILAVEDSRYACDALRLMCQRSGARLRRAETIAAARAHLRCYRPDVVVVDLGLPDGRGEDLIRALASTGRAALLGMSGDPDGRVAALASGAAGFLEKPLAGLVTFQRQIAALVNRPLPPRAGPAGGDDGSPAPDPLALHDDLVHAALLLTEAGEDGSPTAYVAGFVRGLARATGDVALEEAAAEAAATEIAATGSIPTGAGRAPAARAVGRLTRAIAARLTGPVTPLVASRPDAPPAPPASGC